MSAMLCTGATSSIVYRGYQDNFKPVFFLVFTKRFCAHKNMSHLEVYVRVKNCCLCCLVLAYFCFVSWFLLVTCFCARKIFSSKKKTTKKQKQKQKQNNNNNKKFDNLITSIYNTTALVHPNHYKKIFTFFSVRNENAVLQLASFSNCKLVKYVYLLSFCHFK